MSTYTALTKAFIKSLSMSKSNDKRTRITMKVIVAVVVLFIFVPVAIFCSLMTYSLVDNLSYFHIQDLGVAMVFHMISLFSLFFGFNVIFSEFYFSSDIDVSKISFEVSEQDKNYFEYEVNSNKELCIYSILKSDEERTIIIKENNIPATYCKFKINENGTFKDLFIQRRFMLYESLNKSASNELTNLSIDNRNEEITIYVREGAFSNSSSNNINRTGVTMYMDPTTTESPAVIGTPSANVSIQTVNIEDGKISFTIPDTLEAGKYLTYFEYDGLYSIAVEITINKKATV